MTSTPDAPTTPPAPARSGAPTSSEGSSLLPTLPGAAYVEQQWFDRECDAFFESMWFCAVHGSDVPEPGSFRRVQIGRESILITRTRKGEVRAFHNVCRHRGALVCTEDSGRRDRSFQCPYHAWTYDFEGKLIAAPNLTSMPDVDRVEFGLKNVHVREWCGYVWVSLAADPPSFETTVVQDVVDRLGTVDNLAGYDLDGLKVGRRITYDVKANWKLIVENFQECYHCASIHPELTEMLPEFADGYAAQYYVDHGAEFASGAEGFTIDGQGGFGTLPTLDPRRDRKYYAITLRPQVFVNLVPDHVIWHRMFPLGPDRTIVECDWLFAPDVVASGADLSASVELFHRVNVQDFDACERCQPAMSSKLYASGGVLVPSEHHLTAFHDWVRTATGLG